MTCFAQYALVPLSIISVVVPIAVYFLILGLLNSRSRPQLLRSTEDGVLLGGSMSLVFIPVAVSQLGTSVTALMVVAAGLAAATWMLVSPARAWIIYNLTPSAAREAVAKALSAMGLADSCQDGRFSLSEGVTLEVRHFPLLRNTSVRLTGGDRPLARQFEAALASRLNATQTEANPAAAACVLVATAMLIVPLTLAAHESGQIVRLISDLLP